MAKAELKTKATGAPLRMWGPGIIGFGDVHLKHESGRELDWFICGFSPRKHSLSLYGLSSASLATEKLLGKLGREQCPTLDRQADRR
jgi:hypothetical protein